MRQQERESDHGGAGDRYPYDPFARPEMLELVPAAAASILDLGCGVGGFAHGLRSERRGLTMWGIEIDPSAAKIAAPHYDRVLVGTLPDMLQECDRRFDCIVANDILEHLADPWDAVSLLTQYLEPEGVIIASLPNVRHLPVVWDLAVRGRWEYVETGILDRTHLRFFTRQSAISLFTGCGLIIDHIQGINSLAAVGSRRWRSASRLLPECLADMRFLQFAVVARKDPELAAA